ncbi:MAG: cytochrome P460 family protein [Bacteriovorax sp.]|jgi:hypothetical protein
MLYKLIILFNSFFCLITIANTSENKIYKIIPNDKYSGQLEKNGINLNEILKNFDQDFKFVSSHFREDKFEIRLIYANQLGMEGLKSKDHKFKDGSIFYKVVYLTMHDPLFEASLMPEAQPIVRQIMVHDDKRFKKYNGWGFAIFTEKGDTVSGSPESTLETCYACHRLAEDRGSVFSIPMETLVPNNKVLGNHYSANEIKNSKVLSKKLFKYKTVSFESIDPDIKVILNQKTKIINLLDGEILKMDFSIFIPELSSFLVKKTRISGIPSLAVRSFDNQQMFNYAFIDIGSKECASNEKLVRFGWGLKPAGSGRRTSASMKKCLTEKPRRKF